MKPLSITHHRGFTIELHRDPDPESPRENDNLGRIVTWHRRYRLGDEQPKAGPVEFSTDKQLADAVKLPLYLMDHSGLSIATAPFSCPWDSGWVGFIYCTLAKAVTEIGRLGMTWDSPMPVNGEQPVITLRDRVRAILIAEVKEYDDFLSGRVYGFVVKDRHGKEVNSCWGFIGDPERVRNDGMLEAEACAAYSERLEHETQIAECYP